MKRRSFLKTVGGGVAAALAPGCATETVQQKAPTASRPNILWLISEDTSPDFACYGTTGVCNRLLYTA